MTIAQKMRDERRIGFREGRAEGRTEGINEAIAALSGILEPSVLAERFNVPIEHVLKIFEKM